MTRNNFYKILPMAALIAPMTLVSSATGAFADSFLITYLAAGVQAPTGITNYYETFDKATISQGILTTNFNGSPITATYSGNFAILPADQYGGAEGSLYISTAGAACSYTLSLNQPVNYFGLWFSALDGGNYLDFYNSNVLVESFSPKDFIHLVGSCPAAANQFCGNPNNGLDPGEQFAYLNFYDTSGTFNTIVFGQTVNPAQLESDNHAVANLTTAPGGTVISGDNAPEPASLFLVGTGIVGIALGFHYKSTRRFTDPRS